MSQVLVVLYKHDLHIACCEKTGKPVWFSINNQHESQSKVTGVEKVHKWTYTYMEIYFCVCVCSLV